MMMMMMMMMMTTMTSRMTMNHASVIQCANTSPDDEQAELSTVC